MLVCVPGWCLARRVEYVVSGRALVDAGTMNTFYFVRSVLDCADDPAGCVRTDRSTTIVSVLSLMTSAVMLGNKAGVFRAHQTTQSQSITADYFGPA